MEGEDPGIYFDQHGLIVQRDGDGGDTAQREGFAWFGKWMREHHLHDPWPVELPITLRATLDLLEAPGKPGEFRRHPSHHGRGHLASPAIVQ